MSVSGFAQGDAGIPGKDGGPGDPVSALILSLAVEMENSGTTWSVLLGEKSFQALHYSDNEEGLKSAKCNKHYN